MAVMLRRPGAGTGTVARGAFCARILDRKMPRIVFFYRAYTLCRASAHEAGATRT